MPVYDYRCTACGHRTDILHGVNTPGPNFCPECGAEGSMRKAISAPSIHFKGSGWAKKDRASTTKTKATTKADAGGGDGTSGESKTEPASSGAAGPSKPASPAAEAD